MSFGSTIGQVFFIMIFMMVFAQLFIVQHSQNKLQTELFSYQQAKLSENNGLKLELYSVHYNTTFNTVNFAIKNIGSESINMLKSDFYVGFYRFDRNYTERKMEACVFIEGYRCGEIRFGDNSNAEDTNLQLLYHMNNDTDYGPGAIIDNYASTLNANDLTPSQITTNTTAKFGRSLYFNGVNAYATDGNSGQNSFTNTTSYTWSFWINPTSSTGNANTIVSKNAAATGYSIYIQPNGTLQMKSANGGTVFNCIRQIPYNQWSHVAIVYVGTAAGQVRFYINGTSANNISTASIFRSDSGLFQIGRNDSTSSDYYHGLIDEYAQYNTAKTDAQIRALYYKGLFGGGEKIFEPGEILELDARINLSTGTYTVTFASEEGATISSQITI